MGYEPTTATGDPMATHSESGDRNLLYGVMAVQMGFISRDALVAALSEWAATRSRPLSEILIAHGVLSAQDHPTIALVVQSLLDKHGDPSTTLTALDFDLIDPGGDLLASLNDPEVSRRLAMLDTGAGAAMALDMGDTVAWSQSDPGAILKPSDRRAKRPRPASTSERFRILRLHARGGLGEVYLARDEELDRTVALKEIREEYARSEKLRERFVREAEINGNLEHPGIVPVYGLGTHADGRPYYAMRFVEGETLQVALERFHEGAAERDAADWTIGLRQLLRRFLAICDAIDYAHNRSVLHRDLKPSNILLGKFGETLIIDWGLVKIMGVAEPSEGGGEPVAAASSGSRTDDPVSSTVAGETMGSPPFMSPEQARGDHDRLLPSSDIYSLGATLYAVITGVAPIVNCTVPEALEKVARGEIPLPSEANPRVPRALEAICRKAMRMEPARRYPSARALADDLESWLDDRPVAVYHDPVSTRVLRWSRHHRSFVAATMALMVATVVALGIITLVVNDQKTRADQARLQAEAATRRANDHLQDGLEVFDQLVTLGDRQLITQTNPAKRAQFLEAASNFIRRVREGETENRSLQIWTASVARRLANLHRLTGRFALGDPFYDEAVAVLRNVVRRDSKPINKDLLAETLIDQGDSWLIRGKASRAEGLFAEALTIARQNVTIDADNPAFQRTLSRAAGRLAAAHLVTADPDAVDLARQALDAVKPLAEMALPTVKTDVLEGQILPLTDQLELVQARYTMAEALEQAGRREQAEEQLNQARLLMQMLQERFEGIDVAEIQYFLAWVETRLARLTSRDPDDAKAIALLESAIPRLADLAGKHPEFPHFRASLAEAQAAAATIHERQGRLAKARECGESARSTIDPLATSDPDVPEYASLLAEALNVLGRVARRGGADEQTRAATLFAGAVRNQTAAANASPENALFKTRLREYQEDWNAIRNNQ